MKAIGSTLRDHKARTWGVVIALVLVIGAIPVVPTWKDPGDPLDEGLLLLEPELLLDGVIPYRDYESFYGPANTGVLAAVFSVTGPDVVAERSIGLLYRLAVVAAVFALAAPSGLWVAAAAGLIAGVLAIGPAALAWYGGLALALWSLWALQRASGPGAATRWAGIAAGLAISYRPQFAVAAALGALPLLAGRPLNIARSFALWTLIGAIPMLLMLVLAGPAQVFGNLIVDALFRSGPQSTLPWPELSEPSGRLLVLLLGSIGVIAASAAVAWRRAPGDPEARRLASIALLSLGLLPQAVGRAETHHILDVGCVTVALVPTVVASHLVLGQFPLSARRIGAVAATALAVFMLASTWLGGVEANYRRAIGDSPDPVTASYDQKENWVTRGSRSFPFFSPELASRADDALDAVDELTTSGDRLVVGPGDLRRTFYSQTALYHLLPELVPGTYHLTMAPGTANRPGAPLADDIEKADVVVLETSTQWQSVAPNSELGSDDAADALAAHHCLRESNLSYQIYTRC